MNETSKATVLVVEDDPILAKVVRFVLQRAGLSAEIARDGREAWAKCHQKQFDLVVTDEQMPMMTGQELCRMLRSDERYAEIPIIFLTVKKLEMDVQRVKDEWGVSAVMCKPFSPWNLVSTIEDTLSNREPPLALACPSSPSPAEPVPQP